MNNPRLRSFSDPEVDHAQPPGDVPAKATDPLVAAAEYYESESGFTPQQYLASIVNRAGKQGRANALLADVEWYRRHTEDVAQKLRRAVNRAI